jgi:hypothetical protein
MQMSETIYRGQCASSHLLLVASLIGTLKDSVIAPIFMRQPRANTRSNTVL